MPTKKHRAKKNNRTKTTEPTYAYTLTLTEAVIQGFIEHLKYRIHRSTRDAVRLTRRATSAGQICTYRRTTFVSMTRYSART